MYVNADRIQSLRYTTYGVPYEVESSTYSDEFLRNVVSTGYMGMEYERELDGYLASGRFYDPASGRYTSEAASGLLLGAQNLYAFANNTPADRVAGGVTSVVMTSDDPLLGIKSDVDEFWSGFHFREQVASNFQWYREQAAGAAQWVRAHGDRAAWDYRERHYQIAFATGITAIGFRGELGAKGINIGASLLSALLDPLSVYDGISYQAGQYYDAGGGGLNGTVLAIIGTLGLTNVGESIFGVDILTNEVISGDERFDRGMLGISATLTLAGSPGLTSGGRTALGLAARTGPHVGQVAKAVTQTVVSSSAKLGRRVAAATGRWNAPSSAVAQIGRNLGAPTPTFSLLQRWKLWGKHRDTLSQLKKATPGQDVLLSDITSDRSLSGITKLMGELTAGGGKEIGLLRTRQGLVLRQGFVRGGKQYLDIQGASRLIAHSHPNGRIGLSAADRLQIFGDLGQKSTIILGPKGFWRRIADDLSIVGGNF